MAKLPDNPYALTPKRWRFVQEYLKDLNATQAAVRAGYAAKRADQQGYELLTIPEVKAAVDKEKDRIAEALECSRGDIMLELQAVAFANLADFGHWLSDGSFLIKDMEDIPKHLLGAIQKVDNLRTFNKDGELVKEQIKLWLHPKLDALKTLANIKKIDNQPPPVLVDNRTVNVKQVVDKYSEALEDVAATIEAVPLKQLPTEEDTDE